MQHQTLSFTYYYQHTNAGKDTGISLHLSFLLTHLFHPILPYPVSFPSLGVDMLNMGVGKDPGFGVGKMVKDAIHSAIEGNLQR